MSSFSYQYNSCTEKGKLFNNEDAILSLDLGNGSYFFAVADGMGVKEGGEVASSFSLYMIENHLKKLFQNSTIIVDNLKLILSDLFEVAQEAIRDFINRDQELNGMATTLTMLLIHDNKYVWGNMGDSRLYLLSGDDVKRLTRDHTIAEDSDTTFVLHGKDLPKHFEHQLTRKIDGGDHKPEIYPLGKLWSKVDKDTSWVLCSDGLLVDRRRDFNELFANFKFSRQHMNCLAQGLVKKALKNGSTDNISVILVSAFANGISEENSPIKLTAEKSEESPAEDIKETNIQPSFSLLSFFKNLLKGMGFTVSSQRV